MNLEDHCVASFSLSLSSWWMEGLNNVSLLMAGIGECYAAAARPPCSSLAAMDDVNDFQNHSRGYRERESVLLPVRVIGTLS